MLVYFYFPLAPFLTMVGVKTGFAFTNKRTDGDNSHKLLLGKGFPWGHSLAAGRIGIYYGC